jgi:hypothetical protein
MPVNVKRFEWLAYGGVVAGILSIPLIPGCAELLLRHGYANAVVIVAIAVALALLPIVCAARLRRNWARWVYTGMTVAGLPLYVHGIIQLGKANLAGAILQAFAASLAISAIWFVFTGDAVDWFRRSHQST